MPYALQLRASPLRQLSKCLNSSSKSWVWAPRLAFGIPNTAFVEMVKSREWQQIVKNGKRKHAKLTDFYFVLFTHVSIDYWCCFSHVIPAFQGLPIHFCPVHHAEGCVQRPCCNREDILLPQVPRGHPPRRGPKFQCSPYMFHLLGCPRKLGSKVRISGL